jgi:hypothetical protein
MNGIYRGAVERIAAYLAAIHAAPSWLWGALVAALIADDWTVEQARKAAPGGHKGRGEAIFVSGAVNLACRRARRPRHVTGIEIGWLPLPWRSVSFVPRGPL